MDIRYIARYYLALFNNFMYAVGGFDWMHQSQRYVVGSFGNMLD
jgi:hypothetical protein